MVLTYISNILIFLRYKRLRKKEGKNKRIEESKKFVVRVM